MPLDFIFSNLFIIWRPLSLTTNVGKTYNSNPRQSASLSSRMLPSTSNVRSIRSTSISWPTCRRYQHWHSVHHLQEDLRHPRHPQVRYLPSLLPKIVNFTRRDATHPATHALRQQSLQGLVRKGKSGDQCIPRAIVTSGHSRCQGRALSLYRIILGLERAHRLRNRPLDVIHVLLLGTIPARLLPIRLVGAIGAKIVLSVHQPHAQSATPVQSGTGRQSRSVGTR